MSLPLAAGSLPPMPPAYASLVYAAKAAIADPSSTAAAQTRAAFHLSVYQSWVAEGANRNDFTENTGANPASSTKGTLEEELEISRARLAALKRWSKASKNSISTQVFMQDLPHDIRLWLES